MIIGASATMQRAGIPEDDKMGRKRKSSLTVRFLTIFLNVAVWGSVAGVIVLCIGVSAGIFPLEQKEQQTDSSRGTLSDIFEDNVSDEEGFLEADGSTEGKKKGTVHQKKGEVTLGFAGDILFDDYYSMIATMKARNVGIRDCFSEDLLTEMQDADVFMVNNEFTYTDRGEPTPGKQFTFRAAPENAALLHEIGVDIVSVANNHAYDYGEVSFLDTLETLQNADMPYVGGGHNIEEASAAAYFEINHLKVGYLAATQIERMGNPDTKGASQNTPGVFRCYNPENLYAAIADAKENCDFVVVYVHWGTENTEAPDSLQREQAKGMAEAGADLIIGDHPHCLQGIEYVEGTPVIYSLGNFWFNSKALDTCMVTVTIDEKGIKAFRFLPARQEDCTTFLLHDSEKERVISYMQSLSPGVFIDGDGCVTDKEL